MTQEKPLTLRKNNNGSLSLGGVNLDSLAEEHGTPLYVLDEATVRHYCRAYTAPLKKSYPNHQVIYASKANLNVGLARLMGEEGLGLDVVSGGEIYTALQTDIPRDQLYFHGNNKSESELKLALDNKIKIVVDNWDELETLASLSKNSPPAQLLIRLKPEIDAHTHEYIKTGQLDSKFGIEKKDLIPFATFIKDCPTLNFIGIHSHIGSQIFDNAPFEELIPIMIEHLLTLKNDCQLEVQELNLGGGIGIQYTDEDKPLSLEPFLTQLAKSLLSACKTANLSPPKLCLEPGRSIIGNAGITLYRVGAIKDIPGIKKYIFVDGGMADNPRPIIYKAKHSFELNKDCENLQKETYSIAGKFCESGDILAEDVILPEVNKGDLLIVYSTGAYNYSMASNYNRAGKPAMVMVNDGDVRTLVKRESFEDLIRLDVH